MDIQCHNDVDTDSDYANQLFHIVSIINCSITLFVPVSLFNSWTSAQAEFTFMNYVKLIWFVSSLGLLAGAMGSTVEDEEKIRKITYSYRQYHRYKEAQEEKEEQEQQHEPSQQEVERQSTSDDSDDDEYEEKNKIIERRVINV